MPRPAPDLATLGMVLRALREDRGWTQEKLYLKTRIATPLISAVENGRRNPSFDTIERWLAGLGVTWEDFGSALHRAARGRR